MPFCSNCGKELARGDKLCTKCGSKQVIKSLIGEGSAGSIHAGERALRCPGCGKILPSDSKTILYFGQYSKTVFRAERKKGEIPLCRDCFFKKRTLIEQKSAESRQVTFRRQPLLLHRPQVQKQSKREEVSGEGNIRNAPKPISNIEFVLIPAGRFIMGSPHYPDSVPHHVTISKPFYLGKYPVTQREWTKIMGSNRSYCKGEQNPVERVSGNDCQDFIEKLNRVRKGGKYRLPREAEWEYACRAGSKSLFCFGDDKKILKEYAWFYQNSERKTRNVGELKPNNWGLYDMHGNVWEWCSDWYGKYPEKYVDDPTGSVTGSFQAVRGGSCYSNADDCGSAYRRYYLPGRRDSSIGFRLVKEL